MSRVRNTGMIAWHQIFQIFEKLTQFLSSVHELISLAALIALKKCQVVSVIFTVQ